MKLTLTPRLKSALLVLLSIAFVIPVIVIAEDHYEKKLYQQARTALKEKNYPQYLQLESKLKSHPLYPHLRYAYLSKTLKDRNDDEIKQYIEQYEDISLAKYLHHKWLLKLAKQKRWRDFLKYYEPSNHAAVECQRLTAMYHVGDKVVALQNVKPLWLVPHSQPKACDEIFAIWINEGKLDLDTMWQRFKMALDDNQTRVAKYAMKQMPKAEAQKAKLWLQVHRKPRVLKYKTFKQTDTAREIIVYGLTRLARRDPKLAIKLLNKFRINHPLDAKQLDQIHQTIALRLAMRHDSDALLWYRKVKDPQNMKLIHQEWKVRAALLKQDWQQVKKSIEVMAEEDREASKWRYWHARALKKLGKTEQANELYDELAQERHFYGLLASRTLKQPFKINHQRKYFFRYQLYLLEKSAAIIRVKALYDAKLFSSARVEWNDAIKYLDDHKKYIAAQIAAKWGWHEQAIRTANLSTHKDDLELRFPIAHETLVQTAANKNHLKPEMIYAIIRQESAFQHDAVSRVGALGLMQLMPYTAREFAKKAQVEIKNNKDILTPPKNIQLGATYLKELRKQFNGHNALVVAAYNAGHKRVPKWLPKKILPIDIWIETVPWYETRNYIKQVITYHAIYQFRLGVPLSDGNFFGDVVG